MEGHVDTMIRLRDSLREYRVGEEMIDVARKTHPDDKKLQAFMDLQQAKIDAKKERIREAMEYIASCN